MTISLPWTTDSEGPEEHDANSLQRRSSLLVSAHAFVSADLCQCLPLAALVPMLCKKRSLCFEIMSAATKQQCETIVWNIFAFHGHRLHPSFILCSCDDQPSVFVQMSTRTVSHSLVLAFGRSFFSKSCQQPHFRHHFRHRFRANSRVVQTR